MQRREFIRGIVGSAAAFPFAAQARRPRLPVVGFLSSRTAGNSAYLEAALREGLGENGYVDGRDMEIVNHQGAGQIDRLPAMATGLVEKRAAVIVAADRNALIAAKAATTAIPIVFIVGDYPLRSGLSIPYKSGIFIRHFRRRSDIHHPRTNVTGLSLYGYECQRQLFALLCEMMPKRARIALRRGGVPIFPRSTPSTAALWLRQKYSASLTDTQEPIDLAFITIDQLDVRVLFSAPGRKSVEDDRTMRLSQHIFALATEFAAYVRRHGRQIDNWRNPIEVAGSTDDGPGFEDAYRQAGIYAGRILNGAQPADLPVLSSPSSELVISL
jgi:putative tryptophan/tyrosine transport system substrate-binding protein